MIDIHLIIVMIHHIILHPLHHQILCQEIIQNYQLVIYVVMVMISNDSKTIFESITQLIFFFVKKK
jgi:hypothetical protein